MTGVRIRRAGPADVELLATLIEELNANQGEPTGHVTPDAVRRDGFGAVPEFQVLFAEVDGDRRRLRTLPPELVDRGRRAGPLPL